MPYALASDGARTVPRGMSGECRNAGDTGADERGDMTAVRGRVPRVVSVVAPPPSAGPRALPPLTGHDALDGPFQSPHVTEEQQA